MYLALILSLIILSVPFSDHLFHWHLHVGNSDGECDDINNTEYLYITLYFNKCLSWITTFWNIYQTVTTDTIWRHKCWSLLIFFFQNFFSNKKWLIYVITFYLSCNLEVFTYNSNKYYEVWRGVFIYLKSCE